MSARARVERPRGTHDVLPPEQPRWRHVVSEFEAVCALYGYRRIDTPVFEETDLFVRTSGTGSDVVTKEMYTFTDRGDRSLTLRAEATAPIVRAYLEHGMHREPQPVKLYTHETIYRYGRPQKGRFREHWQLDVEAIGADDPAVDAEVIQLFEALLARLGIEDYRLELNSIGDPACRPRYLEERLGPWLAEHAPELDEATRAQAARNPLRALDNIAAKPPAVQALLRRAPAVGDSLCDACRDHFAEVRRYLDAYGVRYEVVPTLVRGLDYYTRTTWEFLGPHGGSTSALSGGGRYAGLAEELGGPHTPGVGFGAGLERILLALDPAAGATEGGVDVFFVCDEGADRPATLRVMMDLRALGLRCDTDYAGRSLKGQLTQAGRLDAATVVVVGPEQVVIRGAGSEDETVGLDEVVGRLAP